jgi:hypothetical protein
MLVTQGLGMNQVEPSVSIKLHQHCQILVHHNLKRVLSMYTQQYIRLSIVINPQLLLWLFQIFRCFNVETLVANHLEKRLLDPAQAQLPYTHSHSTPHIFQLGVLNSEYFL